VQWLSVPAPSRTLLIAKHVTRSKALTFQRWLRGAAFMAQRLTPMLLCQHRPIVRPPRSGIVPMADRRGRTRQPNNSTLPPKKRRLCNEAMQISCSCGLLCVRNRWHKVTFLMLGNQRRVKSAPSSRATHPERAAHHSPSLSSRSPPHSPFVLNFSTRTQCPKRESKFGGGVTVPSFTPFSSFDRFLSLRSTDPYFPFPFQ
jgi:hypothetical protein